MTLLDHFRDPASKKPRASMPVNGVFAALDLGTHNCRMMIAEQDGDRVKVIDSFSQIVRLGESLSDTGYLSEKAMNRTIDALHVCAEKLRKHKVTDAHFVGTEACRTAKNGLQFVERVRNETGMDLKIISTKDEAVLAFLGCSPLVQENTDYALMLDIGGGSTELLLVNMRESIEPRISGWQSLPFGVMTVTENAGPSGLTPATLDKKTQEFAKQFEAFAVRHQLELLVKDYTLQLICCSATITTLAAIQKDLTRYDRREVDGTSLATSTVRDMTSRIRDMSPAERANHPCIGSERAHYVLSGCAILGGALKSLPVEKLTVADRGVREGIIFSLLKKHLRAAN